MQVKTQDKQKHEQCVQVTGAQGLGIRETGSREVPAPPYLNGTMTQIGACSPPPLSNLVCSQLLSKQEGQEELTIPAAENTMVPLKSLPSRLSLVGDRQPFTYFTRKLASVVLGPQTMAQEWESKKTTQTWLYGRATVT